ncbi:MAG TPA: hypothetical protein PKA00_14530 [Saprospiraceae bacterium]|nr:hypothetical protein [Saprospiraceae bacterium]HMQ84126.1 hypothetical protein [Saprospiraceae bacterium]
MDNSKLYTILTHFDKYEQNRCRKYIQSPYFNRSEELVALYDLFVEAINKNSTAALEKAGLWQQLQADKPYDDTRFRKYCSDLLKLVEGYLAQEAFEATPLKKANFLMEELGKRKMEGLYASSIRQARRLSEQLPHRSARYYLQQYEIEQNYFALTEFETKRSEKSNLEEISSNLDVFFVAEKLRILCASITYKSFTTHQYELHFINDILKNIPTLSIEQYPAIALYYQIYLTLTDNENEEHYYVLKKLLEQYGLTFPANEAKDVLYMAAQNYCIGKLNKGNHKFVAELFVLYEDLIQKGILISEGELSPWYFKNIITIALRLGKYDWAENFVKEYAEYLPISFRNNAVTYNLAQIYFYQKKYDQVIEQLRNVEYEDVAYNVGSKAMLLATYYEMEEIEPLYSLLESFRVYLNRHKDIPIDRRKSYSDLIKFTKKLTRTIPGDKKAVQKLKEELYANKDTASFNWLKEKVAELEGESLVKEPGR